MDKVLLGIVMGLVIGLLITAGVIASIDTEGLQITCNDGELSTNIEVTMESIYNDYQITGMECNERGKVVITGSKVILY